MWIKRDLSSFFLRNGSLPVQIVWGPRQCGKSSLLRRVSPDWTYASLDDLMNRRTASADPALFLKQHPPPLVVDECQYAPELLSQVKLVVDDFRHRGPVKEVYFRMTGSHQILLDRKIKESLGGRAHFFRLHGLSLREAQGKFNSIEEFIFRGAWPELFVNPEISALDYLNDYIRTVMEKDVAQAAGVRELEKFQLAMGLLAARVGELVNFDGLATESGVSGPTLKSWVISLERSGLAGLLRPFHSNLNKRLVKTPKFYFLDTGLAARLQGHLDVGQMFRSPSFGHLFENLVLVEILKSRDHFRREWNLFFWRSKDGEEYDFLVISGSKAVVIDAQVAIGSPKPIRLSEAIRRTLSAEAPNLVVCTYGGREQPLSDQCMQIPVANLSDYLQRSL